MKRSKNRLSKCRLLSRRIFSYCISAYLSTYLSNGRSYRCDTRGSTLVTLLFAVSTISITIAILTLSTGCLGVSLKDTATASSISLDHLSANSICAQLIPGTVPSSTKRSEAAIVSLTPFLGSTRKPFLLSASADGLILSWDVRSGKYREIKRLGHRIERFLLASNCRFAVYATSNKVHILALPSGEIVASAPEVRGQISSIALSPRQDALLIGSVDGRIYRWRFANFPKNLNEIKRFERYAGHASVPSAVAFINPGRAFISGDWTGVVFAWLPFDEDDPFKGKYDQLIFGSRFFSDTVTKMELLRADTTRISHLVSLSSNGLIVLANTLGVIEAWSTRGLFKRAFYQAHTGLIYSLVGSPSGNLIATSGRDGAVRIWRFKPPSVEEEATISAQFAVNTTPLGSFELVREYLIPGVQSLVFLDEQHLFGGTVSGTVLELQTS